MTTFISFSGRLAKAPELRTDKNGRPFTFARVIRTDRVRNKQTGEFEDGGTFTWIAPARTFAGANEEYVESEASATPTP